MVGSFLNRRARTLLPYLLIVEGRIMPSLESGYPSTGFVIDDVNIHLYLGFLPT